MLSGGVFLGTLRNFRIAWIGGRYGGGKTAISVRLAYEFYQKGWCKHILANFPCVLATDLDKLDELRDCFIILDEAGAWMKEGEFQRIVAFLRKRNLTVVFPSVLPPPIKARTLNIVRGINYNTIGINAWEYRMNLDYMRVKEQAKLFWFNPKEVFGLWDTSYVTIDSEGIVPFIEKAFYGEENGKAASEESAVGAKLPVGNGNSELEELRGVVGDLYEAQKDTEYALSLHRGKRRKRGN
jgi:hypothetical protein